MDMEELSFRTKMELLQCLTETSKMGNLMELGPTNIKMDLRFTVNGRKES